ncbi:Prophage Lp2 protein 6 [Enhygromyxa salina]|uniref:Prophage Lp2 protein 6 n=1 Tax=Enhygromyxa salina TaxID=215803 RepID=A0A0C2CYF2_9BACT|nr:type I restriction endonuclease [Enhygromyxa salina]KIG16016.1 Prophage Lp2 protein 6 [Enhygromyxa salina]
MSFEEKLKNLAAKADKTRGMLETEEATKNALVMPFIAALGYDVFDPTEVVPEFTADVGIKKGEKVDYVIKRGEDIVMLIEAKKVTADLAIEHSSQLFRYFTTTKARIAVLTNGIVYRFYSDLEESNKMDEKPFLELNLLDLRESLINEVSKLSKSNFDLENMLVAASDLKYMREIRATLERQLETPDEELVKFFFQQAHPNGRFVQSAKDQFSQLVKRTLLGFINDKVSDRLRSALARADDSESEELPAARVVDGDGLSDDNDSANHGSDGGIVTTEAELEGYRVVKAIICDVVAAERVTYRDSKTYFAVLVDDNNRKPICRLHFNRSKKYIGTFDTDKAETRHLIDTPDAIYSVRDLLRATATHWVSLDAADKPAPTADG